MAVRHIRSIRRDDIAVQAILSQAPEGTREVVLHLWELRTKLDWHYTAEQELCSTQISEEMGKPIYDAKKVVELFSDSFQLRTSLVSHNDDLDAVFDHFPLLKSSLYVNLEAQLMLGPEKYGKVLKNANFFFDAIKKLKPKTGGCGWEPFVECMRTIIREPKEFREVNCGGNILGSTPDKYPHMIVVKLPNKTLEQVLVRVGKNVIDGLKSNWQEGVIVLVLAYLVFGFPIHKQSQVIRCLAWVLFGLTGEKKLVNPPAQRLLASLSIL